MFWSGDRVPEGAALEGLPRGGYCYIPQGGYELLESDVYKAHRTGLCGGVWGRPMSSSGRLSAEMMMMMTLRGRHPQPISPHYGP